MPRNKLVRFLILTLLTAAAAIAADVTGKWAGEFAAPDGSSIALEFDLKQSGADVTGTVTGPQGAMNISEGKIDGDKISFAVKVGGEGEGMKVRHAGAFTASEMKLGIKFEGGPEGDHGAMTLKRVK